MKKIQQPKLRYEMKYIIFFLLLNTCLFAGNEIIIKASSEKISFELYGSNSGYSKEDTVRFKLKIHNYSNKKYFFIDPEACDLKPLFNPEFNRVFIHYGGDYFSGYQTYWRFIVLEPGDSLEIPLPIDIKILNPSKSFSSYFVLVDVGYFQYDKDYEYLTKKEDASNRVHFKSLNDEIRFADTYKVIDLCCMPIHVRLKK